MIPETVTKEKGRCMDGAFALGVGRPSHLEREGARHGGKCGAQGYLQCSISSIVRTGAICT